MLEFEHIIQVNDLDNDQIQNIDRNQLWQGLVLRACKPQKFIPGLECSSEQLTENEFVRIIEAGATQFKEQVLLYPQDKITTRTLPEHEQIHAQSVATIEEPSHGALFVRFSYTRELPVDNDNVDVAEHLKSAYVQIDRDAIGMIRMLAESGIYDSLIN